MLKTCGLVSRSGGWDGRFAEGVIGGGLGIGSLELSPDQVGFGCGMYVSIGDMGKRIGRWGGIHSPPESSGMAFPSRSRYESARARGWKRVAMSMLSEYGNAIETVYRVVASIGGRVLVQSRSRVSCERSFAPPAL